jgi:hypothetical protein
MIISKVKPLHIKVEETTKTVNEASGKLAILHGKLQDLEARLSSLANAYEEASIDKCRQFKLTQKLNQQLERASYFENVSIIIGNFYIGRYQCRQYSWNESRPFIALNFLGVVIWVNFILCV